MMVRFVDRSANHSAGRVWAVVATISLVSMACGGAAVSTDEPVDDLDVSVESRSALSQPLAATRANSSNVVSQRPRPTTSSERPASYSRSKRGRRIDLNVRDADLHNLFRLLADVGGVNIVVGQGVGGKVTLALRQVPWRVALNVICQAHQLTITETDSILLIQKRDQS